MPVSTVLTSEYKRRKTMVFESYHFHVIEFSMKPLPNLDLLILPFSLLYPIDICQKAICIRRSTKDRHRGSLGNLGFFIRGANK